MKSVGEEIPGTAAKTVRRRWDLQMKERNTEWKAENR